jgi:hypothetical protein
MELLKLDDRPATFVWKDVTFSFRTKVTVGDKYAVDTSGTVMGDDGISFRPWELYSAMIRIFVVGWSGVTENGQSAAYSYDAMMKRLPGDMAEDLVMKLGVHIAKTNGFIPGDTQQKADDVKND